jgi:Uma2 family endonuclease
MWRKGEETRDGVADRRARKVLALEIDMTQHQHLITVEEFAAMTQDDDWKEELLDGVIRRFPLPKAPHGVACATLAMMLGNYCQETGFGQVSLESGLVVSQNPDSVLGPDVQVFAAHRPPDTLEGWPSVPPVLIVEVVDGTGGFFAHHGQDPVLSQVRG